MRDPKPFLFGLLGDDRPILLISVCYVNRASIWDLSVSQPLTQYMPTVVVPSRLVRSSTPLPRDLSCIIRVGKIPQDLQ